ncbi:hypothetical protein GBF38_010593 [Nibea albiflora]|uniref:Uncharacterized protein n=1 Tax=Nibea albiflora TaxID=240163 RepID=A0ACB7ESF8_NIBAL|nr:hypothetical protein GBF38_010593 [Nibea albiflora]
MMKKQRKAMKVSVSTDGFRHADTRSSPEASVSVRDKRRPVTSERERSDVRYIKALLRTRQTAVGCPAADGGRLSGRRRRSAVRPQTAVGCPAADGVVLLVFVDDLNRKISK